MPLPLRSSRLGRILCSLAGVSALAGAVPAVADACTLNTSGGSEVFAKYGDTNNYVLAPNGIFSGGTAGWSLSNAWLSSGGPGLVAGDGQSLTVGSGGSVTSPSFCIGTSTPTVRFMLRTPSGGPGNTMNAYLLWKDWSGASNDTYIGWVAGSSGWAPSTPLNVSSMPLWESGSTLTVRLQLVPQNGGAWSLDDFFVDPYSKG
jgi:hypothetical protein